jgi:GNAT superfamily N-acetyltransferase
MSQPFTIRPGTLSDLSEVQRLNQALFSYEKSHGLHDDVYNQNWPSSPAGAGYFTECLKGERNQGVFIAEDGSRAIGYLAASCRSYAYLRQNPLAEIENMFVEEPYRHRGVGTALIDAFKSWATDMGAVRFKVGSLALNTPALAFYRRNGFEDFVTYLEMPAE